MRLLALLLLSLACAAPCLAQDAAPGSVLVKLRSGARYGRSMRQAGAEGPGVAVRGTRVRVVPVSGDPRDAARRLDSARGVTWAEPNWTMRALAAPDDPLFARQPDLALLGFPAAWDAAGIGEAAGWPHTGGAPVGIVDTGIDAGHEDLTGRVAACASSSGGRVTPGACADDAGHGTHVAGTIGAAANNGAGIAGIAFASPLIICKALGGDGSGTPADVAACIAWAHQAGAKVISMSLGGPASRTLAAAVTSAWDRGGRAGSLLVAAAGNDGNDTLEFPAALPDVVSVAAVDDQGNPAAFSNANADVELAAPGVDVLSDRAGGGYVQMSGTSMATPHVAAIAALLAGAQPGSAKTLRPRLDATAHDLLAPGRDPATGFGLVDAAAALAKGR